jgi:hypothetical protein
MIDINVVRASDPTVAEQILQVLGALAPFAVLLGVWLGKRWEQSGATESWLRDRRLDVYTRVLSTTAKMQDDGLRATSDRRYAGRLNDIDSMNSALGPLSQLRSEVELLGTKEVAGVASQMQDAYRDLARRTTEACADTPDGDLVPDIDHTWVLVADMAFIRAAQTALGSKVVARKRATAPSTRRSRGRLRRQSASEAAAPEEPAESLVGAPSDQPPPDGRQTPADGSGVAEEVP